MTPARSQLALLLLFLFAITAMSASFITLFSQSGLSVATEHALIKLVLGPLRGHDLLVVSDNYSHCLLDVGGVVAAAGDSLTPALLTSQHSLLHTVHPARHTKGAFTTALVLFHTDPTPFLLLLEANRRWNPGYLVLFCLNSSLNTTSVLGLPIVQRSHFILLLTIAGQGEHTRLHAYTSLPMHTNIQGRSLTKAPLGTWNPNNFSSRKSLFPPRFRDFGGSVLKVPMLCHSQPFQYYDKKGRCVGTLVETLQMIADKVNFTFSLEPKETVVWGVKKNGTWNGLLSGLAYEEKHLVFNILQPNPDRAADFDFTYPYWQDSFGLLMREPPPLPRWRNILYPFSGLMWGCVFATTVLVSSLLALLLHFIEHLSDPVGMAFKIGGGLINQPMVDREVRMWWARLWLVFWWVAVDILAAAYMSNLVAVLTVPSYPARINTFHELFKTNLIPCMYDYGSFVPNALSTSENPSLAAWGKKLYLDPDISLVDPYGALIDKVYEGTHVLIVPIDYLVFTQHRKKLTRSSYIMREKLYPYYASWFLPLHTPYTSTLSNHLIRIMETGILGKLYRMSIGIVLTTDKVPTGDGVLNLGHVQGAFILLGLGLFTASLVLLLEHFIA